MFRRVLIATALGCSTLVLAACGTKNGPAEDTPAKPIASGPKETPPKKDPPVEKVAAPKAAGPETITLHVKDMTERLKLV